jgi:hypothetical protein
MEMPTSRTNSVPSAILAGAAFLMLTAAVVFGNASMSWAREPENETPAFSGIPSRFKLYAHVVGQRLRKPGKERVVGVGTLVRYESDASEKEPVEVTWEFPLKLRLQYGEQKVVFDRNDPAKVIPPKQKDADATQILLEDSLDGFLSIARGGGVTRNLGSGYRMHNADSKDSCIDIIHLIYPDIFHDGKLISKAYWFNCQTKLLGVVTYATPSGSKVDVIISDWRDIQGEKWPFVIERYENGKLTMKLTLDSVTVGKAVDDGIF